MPSWISQDVGRIDGVAKNAILGIPACEKQAGKAVWRTREVTEDRKT